MSHVRYIHSLVQNTPLKVGNKISQIIGSLISVYEVREYWDARQSYDASKPACGSQAKRGYIVSLRQRVSITNPDANSFSSLNPVTSYSDYPVLYVQQVQPDIKNNPLTFYIEDYHPKTLNASVATSANASTTSDQGTSVQYSSGSSTSVTNSFEVSDSVGFFGADMTGSVSLSAGQSTTNTTEQSVSNGKSNSTGVQAGTSSSMTIKDWASYAFLDDHKQNPSWVWGQEYPWNVIDFRNVSISQGTQVSLPGYVQARLYDGKTLYPPSELSQFGFDFVASASWIFYLDGPAQPNDEIVDFQHLCTYWQGSHSAEGGNFSASLLVLENEKAIETVSLNLPLLALDPIVSNGAWNGSVIGFTKTEFIVPPTAQDGQFRLKSGSNTIYATGSGFDAVATNDAVMSATNITTATPVSFTLFFKVVDENIELSLHLKHWKLSAAGCMITIAVNEADPSTPVSPIIRHVDSMEAGSGADNITSITLRSKDYTSTDFYDYLIMGLNTIVVTVTPAQGQESCGYALRAVAIS